MMEFTIVTVILEVVAQLKSKPPQDFFVGPVDIRGWRCEYHERKFMDTSIVMNLLEISNRCAVCRCREGQS